MHPICIMSLSVTMIALSVNLLEQSSGSARQSNYKNTEAKRHSSLPGQKLSDGECDFTTYQPVRESHFVQRTVRKKVKPIYPPEAANRGIQGWVNVKILVDRDGNVEKACAVDGDQTLRYAAEKAALQWKFKPYFGRANAHKAGSRKYMVDVIPFNFDLRTK
jgi:TonB family protein